MADEYRIEFDGLSREQWTSIADAVAKVGTFKFRVWRNEQVVMAGTPKFPEPTARTAPPAFGSTKS